MKMTKNTPKTGALGLAIALTILAIAIASFGYGWHRVVSAQSSDKSEVAPEVVTITEYPLPNASPAARPFGIARRSSDHSMWFAEPATGKIGRITSDGTITEYPLPGAAATSQPTSLVFFGSDDLWFTEYNANKIGRITSVSSVVSIGAIILGTNYAEYSVPTANSHPFGIVITFGAQTTVFFTEKTAGKIGHAVDTTNGTNDSGSITINDFATATANSMPLGIVSGPDGALWFTESAVNRIGQISTAGVNGPEQIIPTANTSPA